MEKKIHAFAKANGWTVEIHDPGLSVIFKKITPNEEAKAQIKGHGHNEPEPSEPDGNGEFDTPLS